MSITIRSDLELEQAARIKYLTLQLATARAALQKIADLDHHEDGDGECNEWAEAACFHKAQRMARSGVETLTMRDSFED